MIRVADKSVSISGAAWAGATLHLTVVCDTEEEAKALAAIVEHQGAPAEGPCKGCLGVQHARDEDNRTFEDARIRFESVARRVQAENEQLKRSMLNLRSELRADDFQRLKTQEGALAAHSQRLGQQLQVEMNEVARLKGELERTQAALVKAQGKDMPTSATVGSDSTERFARLEID